MSTANDAPAFSIGKRLKNYQNLRIFFQRSDSGAIMCFLGEGFVDFPTREGNWNFFQAFCDIQDHVSIQNDRGNLGQPGKKSKSRAKILLTKKTWIFIDFAVWSTYWIDLKGAPFRLTIFTFRLLYVIFGFDSFYHRFSWFICRLPMKRIFKNVIKCEWFNSNYPKKL